MPQIHDKLIPVSLKAYTVEAAYSGFEENIKGKIAKGMLADFVVLSDDISEISSNELLEKKVEQTYVGVLLKYGAKKTAVCN